MHFFLTGRHDAGKTTVIDSIIKTLSGYDIRGFRTFMGEYFAPGKNFVLMAPASENMIDCTDHDHCVQVALRDKSKISFESYPEAFETGGIELLKDAETGDLIIMDELGFMEKDAVNFQKRILELLDGNVPVVGAIKPDSDNFLDDVRNHKKVKVIEVTVDNRDGLPGHIAETIKKEESN